MPVSGWQRGQGERDETPTLLRWLAVDEVPEHQWPHLAALLDEGERARASRFRFRQDYCSYVAAHALGRLLLSSVAGGEPGHWRFTVGAHGKPEVIADVPLRLNLSHTRGLAAAVLSFGDDVGVDVEYLNRELAASQLAARHFAPAEYEALSAAAPGRVTDMFLALWTLKEAYAKATGLGLSLPLCATAFTLDPPAISFRDGFAGVPGDWRFRCLRPTPDHVLALALHHRRPGEPVIEASGMFANSFGCPEALARFRGGGPSAPSPADTLMRI